MGRWYSSPFVSSGGIEWKRCKNRIYFKLVFFLFQSRIPFSMLAFMFNAKELHTLLRIEVRTNGKTFFLTHVI